MEMTYSKTMASTFFRLAPGIFFLMNCDKDFFTMLWCCSIFVMLSSYPMLHGEWKVSRLIDFIWVQDFFWQRKISPKNKIAKRKKALQQQYSFLLYRFSLQHHPWKEPDSIASWEQESDSDGNSILYSFSCTTEFFRWRQRIDIF